MRAKDFELRILSGLHHGARVPLLDQLSVGDTLDHDVFLRDPGFAGQRVMVELADDGWIYTDGGPSNRCGFGKPGMAGNVVFTVDTVGAPWPDLDSIEPASPDAGGPDDAAPIVDEESSKPDAGPTETAAEAAPQRVATQRPAALYAVFIAGTLVIGFMLVAAWLFLRPQQVEAVVSKRQTEADQETITEFKKILVQYKLDRDVRIQVQDDGSIRLIGIVNNDETLEALSGRLASFFPRPALALMTADELKNAVSATARRFSPYLGAECQGSQCKLVGTALSEQSARDAARAIREEAPAVTELRLDVRYPEDIGKRFVAALEKSGIRGFLAKWDGQELNIAGGTLPSHKDREFMRLLASLSEQTHDLIPFRIIVPEEKGKRKAVAETGKPPFDIVAVVGGHFPYVTTSSGENILLGSVFRGYRLVAIRPGEIIFDGPRTLTFKR